MGDAVETAEVIRQRRDELGMSQAELGAKVGVDARQIRCSEAGEVQPSLQVAVSLARALDISVHELAGAPTHRINLSGEWWVCWHTWHDGEEILDPHQIRMRQKGDNIDVVAVTRGTYAFEKGGYLWRGELRLWDNEILMGWYVADEGAVWSKGTMYFIIHQRGLHMTGRWVGLSHDGLVINNHRVE
jgi:DNA-binding XRE family transcriptional regulator